MKIIKLFANVKLAVVIVLGLGVAIAYGTIVEARFNDAQRAQKLVFHSWLMYGLLATLSVSLIAVMIDRWPWKVRHTGFVLAHIGILVLLGGSLITREYGIDGSMVFRIGENSRTVTVSAPEINIYASMGDGRYTLLYNGKHDFMIHPPQNDFAIQAGPHRLEVLEYQPYAVREEKLVPSEAKEDGPAVRFQLQNPNVNMTEWIHQAGEGREVVQDLGPAKVVLTTGNYVPTGQNAIVLKPEKDNETISYAIYSSRQPASAKPKVGKVKAGDTVETGWMGLVLRVLKYLPNAKQEVLYHARPVRTELTSEAIRVRFNGTERWMGMDSPLKFFTDSTMYLIAYGNRRLDLGKVFADESFNMKLQKFEVGLYQGTKRAATYQSLVNVPGQGDVLISMNEPLKLHGFTFYQSSFVQDPKTGEPVASVLSVNYDPGRWIKYLGSLIIVLGIIHLFYFKRKAAAKKSPEKSVGAQA